MYRPPYARPFEKAIPVVRSRSAAGPDVHRRVRSLSSDYRRFFLLAVVLSILAHYGISLGLRGQADWVHPDPIIGHPGPIVVLDIAPIDPERDQTDLARARRKTGALQALEVEPIDVQPEKMESDPDTPVKEPSILVFEAPPPVVRAAPEEPIRFELREDWTVDPRSPEASFSDQIHPLRIVRPEYPDLALENDIQGLVRLEAEVGISGRVMDVRVLEADDGGLALAASRSLLLWEFKPLVVNGRPRKFRIVVPFRFRIVG